MLAVDRGFARRRDDLVVGFDVEWTKNFQRKGANRPFCFSLVCIGRRPSLDRAEQEMEFGVFLRYVDTASELKSLLAEAARALGSLPNRETTVVGHQLSSDIGVAMSCCSREDKTSFRTLKHCWTNRRYGYSGGQFDVFDTRYDMDSFLSRPSRRLVDVCGECNMDVSQPELSWSMTHMQKRFMETGDSSIREKLAILNIRHSLSTAILYLAFASNAKPSKVLNVNRIIYNNLRGDFAYVRSDEFSRLL